MHPIEGASSREIQPVHLVQKTDPASAKLAQKVESQGKVNAQALELCKTIKKSIKMMDLSDVREQLNVLSKADSSPQVDAAIKTLNRAEESLIKKEVSAAGDVAKETALIGKKLFVRNTPLQNTVVEDLNKQLGLVNKLLRMQNPPRISSSELDKAQKNLDQLKQKYGGDVPILADALSEALTVVMQKQLKSSQDDFTIHADWEESVMAQLPAGHDAEKILSDSHLSPLLKEIVSEINKDNPDWKQAILLVKSVLQYSEGQLGDEKLKTDLRLILKAIIDDHPFPELTSIRRLLAAETLKSYEGVNADSHDVLSLYADLVKKPKVVNGISHAPDSVKDANRLGSLKINQNSIQLATDIKDYGDYYIRFDEALRSHLNDQQIQSLEAFINQGTAYNYTTKFAESLNVFSQENPELTQLIPNQISGTLFWEIELKDGKAAIKTGILFAIAEVGKGGVLNVGVVPAQLTLTIPVEKLDRPFGDLRDFEGAMQRISIGRFVPYGDASEEEIQLIHENARFS